MLPLSRGRGLWRPSPGLVILRHTRGICWKDAGTASLLFLQLCYLDLNYSVRVSGLGFVFGDVLGRPLRLRRDLLVEGVLLLLGVVAHVLKEDDAAWGDLVG